ncbi:hypothetical protein H0A71_15865 [Alcaligenaceae bacterium]|nr:hypothetical protein [Alcaligenaceae bacterium]
MNEYSRFVWAERMATLVFLLLFPGFFYWHFNCAWMGLPLLIGFFGQAIILGLIGVFVFSGQMFLVLARSFLLSIPILILLIYCFIWTLAHYVFLPSDSIPAGSMWQIFYLLMSWVALLYVGALSNPFHRRVILALWLSWVGFAVLSATFIDISHLIVNPRDLFGGYNVSYQGFTRSVMIVSIALVASIQKDGLRLVFCALATALIFTFGARSELYGFVFAVGLFELIRIVNKPSWVVPMVVAAIVLMVAVIINFDSLASSRQMNVFSLSADSSWSQRESQTHYALNQIFQNPLSGVFAGHFQAGGVGTYSHNVLSAWVSFGLVGFVVYFAINLLAFFMAVNGVVRKSPSVLWKFAFYLNSASLIMMLTAKPVFWPMVALSWGATANAKWKETAQA